MQHNLEVGEIMQLLEINKDTQYVDLLSIVGSDNIDAVLHLNNLQPSFNIGQQFYAMAEQQIADSADITPTRKASLLNRFTQDSDIFEEVATSDTDDWKLLSQIGTIQGYLRIPDSIEIPDTEHVLGNHEPVPSVVYSKVMRCFYEAPYEVDPSIFNEYSTSKSRSVADFSSATTPSSSPFQMFRIPWGEVTLVSSISGEQIDFPVYPEEVADGRSATYTQMPDLLYQYEPWQIYQSSGPRTQQFTFHFHRDMWTGDHRDGEANKLIRACEANCYADYRGSAVHTAIVSLYVSGKCLISGIMNDVSTTWGGPIGLDGWYLECTLTLNITEVSPEPLSYTTVRNKGLIG